jgi:hypothetical protein
MIYKIVLFIYVSLLLMGCDPKEALDPTNRCLWIVTNNTKEDIWIKSELSVDETEKYLKTNGSYTFYRGGVPKGEVVDFQDFFIAYIKDSHLLFQTVEIYNADKTRLLKKWTISELNNPGCQFFNEKCWTKEEWQSKEPYETFTTSDGWYNYHRWTFEITSEDIVSP